MTVDVAPRARLGYGALQLAAPPRDAGPVLFEASTETLNRYGFKLAHSRWRISNYQRNPIVGWAHDMSRPPIGRARAELDGFTRTLRAAVTFDELDPFAAEVSRKVRAGFLNAVSVGWDFTRQDGSPILEWWRLKPEQIEREAWYDLTEISVVPVPGDPAAVRVGQSLGGAGAVTADGAARLLAAVSLDDAAVVVGRVVREVLAERAATRAAARACFGPVPFDPPVVGGR